MGAAGLLAFATTAEMILSETPACFIAITASESTAYCPCWLFTIPTITSSPKPALTSFRIVSFVSTALARWAEAEGVGGTV